MVTTPKVSINPHKHPRVLRSRFNGACTHLLSGYPFPGLGTRERVGAPADQSSFFQSPALVDDLLGETVLQVDLYIADVCALLVRASMG